MGENGFLSSKLFGLRTEWDNDDVVDVEDSHGQQWVSIYYVVDNFYYYRIAEKFRGLQFSRISRFFAQPRKFYPRILSKAKN